MVKKIECKKCFKWEQIEDSPIGECLAHPPFPMPITSEGETKIVNIRPRMREDDMCYDFAPKTSPSISLLN